MDAQDEFERNLVIMAMSSKLDEPTRFASLLRTTVASFMRMASMTEVELGRKDFLELAELAYEHINGLHQEHVLAMKKTGN